MSTHLKRFGLLKKMFIGFVMGCCTSFLFVILAIVVPFWPITLPLFLIMAVGAPFVGPFCFLGYQAGGNCPACGQYLEVTKRSGGLRCRACKTPLRIAGNRLHRV